MTILVNSTLDVVKARFMNKVASRKIQIKATEKPKNCIGYVGYSRNV